MAWGSLVTTIFTHVMVISKNLFSTAVDNQIIRHKTHVNYAFLTNPQPMNTAFFLSFGDHTSGTGRMMVIDGNTTGGAQRFWWLGNTGGGVCGLTVGATYTFSYWIRSASSTVTDLSTQADIGIQVNNAAGLTLTGSV